MNKKNIFDNYKTFIIDKDAYTNLKNLKLSNQRKKKKKPYRLQAFTKYIFLFIL